MEDFVVKKTPKNHIQVHCLHEFSTWIYQRTSGGSSTFVLRRIVPQVYSIYLHYLLHIMLCIYYNLLFHLTLGCGWVGIMGTRVVHKPYTTTKIDLKFWLKYIHVQLQMSVGTSYSKGSSLALTENNSVEPATTDNITGSAFHT